MKKQETEKPVIKPGDILIFTDDAGAEVFSAEVKTP